MLEIDREDNRYWADIEPLLNEGLDELNETDRAAVLLRFFRGQSMLEVAENLGTTEAAAKMRVGRAVEKLRTFFSQHGVVCSAAVLLFLLEQNAAAQPSAAIIGSVLQSVGQSPPGANHFRPRSGQRLSWLAVVPAAAVFGLLLLLWLGRGKSVAWHNSPPLRPIAQSTPLPPKTTLLAAAAAKPKAVRTQSLRLVVRDGNASAPLPGVKIISGNLNANRTETFTDATGLAEITLPTLAAADFDFWIRAEMDGYAGMLVSWSRFQRDDPADIPDYYELKLFPGIRVGGLVTDEAGQPVEGVQVRLQSTIRNAELPPRQRARLNYGWAETVLTDAEGRWSCNRLPPDWENLIFQLNSRQFLPAEFVCDATRHPRTGQVAVPKADLLGGQLRTQLKRGLQVTGQVTDQMGQPIAGVRIVENLKWSDSFAVVTSQSDGTYSILNAAPGALKLSFQADHYAPESITLNLDGPTNGPVVVLKVGQRLHGHVLDSNGQPLAGVELEIDAAAGELFQWSARTDSSGVFSWNGAPQKSLAIRVFKPGFRTAQIALTPDGSDHLVTLESDEPDSQFTLKGIVVDAATGLPIPVFQVITTEGPYNQPVNKEGMAGKYSISLSRQAQPMKLQVQADGYEPTSKPISPTDGNQTVDFRLRRIGSWDGQVLLPDGQPAVGAEVAQGKHIGGSPILGRRRLLYREECVYRLTDSDGRFHFDLQKDVALMIAVHQTGYAEWTPDSLATNPVIRLQPWGRIEGRLSASTHRLPEETIWLRKRGWTPWVQVHFLPNEPFMVLADANGGFAFEDVPPGDLVIGRNMLGRLAEDRTTVVVRPGETLTVVLGGNGRPVTGRIHATKVEDGFDFSHSSGILKIALPKPADLPNLARRKDFATDEAYHAAELLDGLRRLNWWQSSEGLEVWRKTLSYSVWFEPDGTLHGDDIPAGDYFLNVFLRKPATPPKAGANPDPRRVFPPGGFIPFGGPQTAKVTIPASNSAESQVSVDLGTIELKEIVY